MRRLGGCGDLPNPVAYRARVEGEEGNIERWPPRHLVADDVLPALGVRAQERGAELGVVRQADLVGGAGRARASWS